MWYLFENPKSFLGDSGMTYGEMLWSRVDLQDTDYWISVLDSQKLQLNFVDYSSLSNKHAAQLIDYWKTFSPLPQKAPKKNLLYPW